MNTNTSHSSAEFPLVTDDYHLIVSQEEFYNYQATSKRRHFLIITAIIASVAIIVSISVAVIPMFLKANLELSHGEDNTHSAPTEIHESENISVKAVYSE